MGSRGARFPARVLATFACLAVPAALAAQVTVFAAASLKESLDAVARGYEAATGDKVVVSYAGSNALAKQVENGAPADVFISADSDWVAYLEKRGLTVPGSRRDLLGNDLVLVAPAASKVSLGLVPGVNLVAALGDRRLAIANPDAVPAGMYAKDALTMLGAWPAVAKRLAPTESVRAALLLVARGEAPLGIVYRTDALAEPRVRIVDKFPEATHPQIVYPVVRVKRGTSPSAQRFEDYLGSPQARGVFEHYGFVGL